MQMTRPVCFECSIGHSEPIIEPSVIVTVNEEDIEDKQRKIERFLKGA